ncbi:FCD domain-containing protein [Actinoplanes bogorensis]|uniref:FCD domain-containing protein n=1 Tax=Paractinoplanes bogorensis TaxID=1610840 RepID=A0ABS5YKW3_9ACTN|nr:FCD domain-containing protein [Actinoplanes bogorensis]MBU2664105.1 FCD domain-containing protein [Actinoplanes bogorensis]
MIVPAASYGDSVTDALVERLRSVGVGKRIPGERLLSDELGVSRTLLRDRLGTLEALGVLRRQTGAGTYVQELDPSRLGNALTIGLALSHQSTGSLQSVRVALERQAAREAAAQRNHLDIAHMHIALDVIESNPDSATSEQADFDFHDALLRASGNPSIRFFADALGVALRRTFSQRRVILERIDGYQEMVCRVHRPILEAILAGDGATAMTAVDAHFDAFDNAVAELGLPAPGDA